MPAARRESRSLGVGARGAARGAAGEGGGVDDLDAPGEAGLSPDDGAGWDVAGRARREGFHFRSLAGRLLLTGGAGVGIGIGVAGRAQDDGLAGAEALALGGGDDGAGGDVEGCAGEVGEEDIAPGVGVGRSMTPEERARLMSATMVEKRRAGRRLSGRGWPAWGMRACTGTETVVWDNWGAMRTVVWGSSSTTEARRARTAAVDSVARARNVKTGMGMASGPGPTRRERRRPS